MRVQKLNRKKKIYYFAGFFTKKTIDCASNE